MGGMLHIHTKLGSSSLPAALYFPAAVCSWALQEQAEQHGLVGEPGNGAQAAECARVGAKASEAPSSEQIWQHPLGSPDSLSYMSTCAGHKEAAILCLACCNESWK